MSQMGHVPSAWDMSHYHGTHTFFMCHDSSWDLSHLDGTSSYLMGPVPGWDMSRQHGTGVWTIPSCMCFIGHVLSGWDISHVHGTCPVIKSDHVTPCAMLPPHGTCPPG